MQTITTLSIRTAFAQTSKPRVFSIRRSLHCSAYKMDKLQNTIAENIKGGNVTAKPEHKFSLEQVPPQDGKGIV